MKPNNQPVKCKDCRKPAELEVTKHWKIWTCENDKCLSYSITVKKEPYYQRKKKNE